MTDDIILIISGTVIFAGCLCFFLGCLVGYRAGKEEGERAVLEDTLARGIERGILIAEQLNRR